MNKQTPQVKRKILNDWLKKGEPEGYRKDFITLLKRTVQPEKSLLAKIDLFEDLLALANKKYLASVKKAREEFKKGEVLTHQQVFGEKFISNLKLNFSSTRLDLRR